MTGTGPTTLRYTRRHLPHWIVGDHTYFVTIRLAGTIPRSVVRLMVEERSRLVAAGESDEGMLALSRQQFIRIDRMLDAPEPGNCWLTEPIVAGQVLASLAWLESPSRGWTVYAACLMGTHIHMVMRNGIGRSEHLLRDLGQFKRHTARESNRMLGRSGAFWAREDFDHWCRTPEKVLAAIRYTANNPVAAGLCASWPEWPWTKVHRDWVVAAGL